ncbi:sialin-like [Bacillus rossius redtenbacheri]|uniref:sialin-like n=1 Tax=Bacillus rossius redtenbacheri TaxID=93214 RepID=UPI002FDCD7A0
MADNTRAHAKVCKRPAPPPTKKQRMAALKPAANPKPGTSTNRTKVVTGARSCRNLHMEMVPAEEECLNSSARDERYKSTDNIGPRWMIWRRRRDVFCLLAVFGLMNVSMLRSNLSVAIVAMTSDRRVTLSNGTVILARRDFDWDAATRGHVLSAFFYGYAATQVPGGWLAIRFGGHRTYGAGMLVTAVATALTPLLAAAHVHLLVAARVVVGLSEVSALSRLPCHTRRNPSTYPCWQGLTHPGLEILIAQWFPTPERNLLVGVLMTGSTLGIFVSMATSGYVASSLGWQYIFYMTGAMCTVWVICWWFLTSESPQTDPRITLSEMNYIRKHATTIEYKKMAHSVPWLRLLSSVPMWSAVFVIFVTSWNFNVLSIQMPSYFKEKLHIKLQKAGLFSAIPYVFVTLVSLVNGYLLDLALAKKWLTATQLRKLTVCTALVGTACTLLILGHVEMKSPLPVVLCTSVAVACDYYTSLAIYLNFLDLAPQFASIMTGMAHVVSSCGAALTTEVTGHVVTNKTDEEWRTVFDISSGVGLLGAALYGLLGSGELQRWAPRPRAPDESSWAQTTDAHSGQ